MFNLISFVVRSKKRIALLKSLASPKTPTQLAKELNVHRSAISRDLLKLASRGLVKCLTPKEKVFRFYQINSKGQKILQEVEKFAY
jgi:predicted transcriptional regulator